MRNVAFLAIVILLVVAGSVLVIQRNMQQGGDTSLSPSPVTTTSPTGPASPYADTMIVSIYLVALEDNGQSGRKIGCNDSLIPVRREIEKTETPLRAAIEELLSMKDQYFGESGLYNSLYQSDLSVESTTVEDGSATVRLSGQHRLGGTCDTPRFIEQLRETVLQFPDVTEVEFFLNGQPLGDALSGRG